jgi:hypothetical protein
MAQAVVLVAVAVVSAYSAIKTGNAAKKSADDQATRLREKAAAVEAASHRDAEEERRNAMLAYSRALALAGSQGGSVDDPTMVNLLGDINAEGEYRVLSTLYSGKVAASDMESQAQIIQNEGKAAKKSGQLKAASTILSSIGSIYGAGAMGKGIPDYAKYGGVGGTGAGMASANSGLLTSYA